MLSYRAYIEAMTHVVIAPTRRALEPAQLGPDAETNIIVVYNATRDILTSGYQIQHDGSGDKQSRGS